MLHANSSGKRNATMLISAILQVLIVELIYCNSDRWHAQALVMIVPQHMPLYTILLQAQLYYMAFVATSRLRIDPFIQPFAMGLLMLLLAFPFELLGTKFLWWTWHDTDPLLAVRLIGVPCHALFYTYFFAIAFLGVHHILRSTLILGEYYEEVHWKSEWSYILLMPLLTTLFAMGFLILCYHVTVHLIGVEAQDRAYCSFGWLIAKEERVLAFEALLISDDPHVQQVLDTLDAYDSDWLYASIDHAVNQMAFLLYLSLVLLVLFINPTKIVSLGHHQPLGNCLENEPFYSLVGMQYHRKKYLCVHDFYAEFNLCNYPLTQLHYEDSWYMICGRGYENFATYLALSISSFLGINFLLVQVLKRPHPTEKCLSNKTRYFSFRKCTFKVPV
ncbi:hypothetical protein CCR75_004755 [Bremia lactucae]|uniref:DUF7802 domain-containing protein n=1 Tax=Bremia lactucae TaxID=4779 RepID=A0A976FLZ3_BRELC|nr:hypothetical protein CCR75_004755 [Bremia lactucae]